MCTLIVLHRPDPSVPLVIAANRDEYLDRPAAGPAVIESGGRRVLAPLDLRAGGTWLGVAETGVFAALTNRPCPAPDPARRSRGLLVTEALAAPTAAEAAARLGSLSEGAYNPFNLFVADGLRAFVVVYEQGPIVTELAPGAHLIGNADPDDRSVPKVARLLEQTERVAEGPAEWWLEGLAAVCRSHEGDGGPLAPACVHAGGYGTRSSTLLKLAAEPARSELRHADGPPCSAEYDEFSPLLRQLLRVEHGAGEKTARSLG
jgi:uncharacterized protein with NRDE domain